VNLIQLDFTPTARQDEQPASLSGDIGAALSAIRESVPAVPSDLGLVNRLREEERRSAEGRRSRRRRPLSTRCGSTRARGLPDRDAIVVDGGDFVSFAGRVWETWEPGTWMDPGPYGCLGAGPGRRSGPARPPRAPGLPAAGEGCLGFSGMEFDTMVRHNLPIVAAMGNNGIWAPSTPMKFPLRLLDRRRVRPETRYDEVVRSGGHGSWSAPRRAAQPSTAPLPLASPRWSTCSPTPTSSTRGRRIWRSAGTGEYPGW
jgi:acetolactate synthase-1/2/3 large subunit